MLSILDQEKGIPSPILLKWSSVFVLFSVFVVYVPYFFFDDLWNVFKK